MLKMRKANLLMLIVFLTGAASLAVEILGARLVSPFFGGTVFVWASLMTATLAGLAVGYALGARANLLERQAVFLWTALILSGALAALMPAQSKVILELMEPLGMRFGPLLSALFLFCPFFILTGAIVPIVIHLEPTPERNGTVAGKIYSVSTAGSLFGAIVAGFILLPNFPLDRIFISLGGLLILLGMLRSRFSPKSLLLLALLGLVFAASSTQKSKEASWFKTLDRSESFYSSIRVIEGGGLRCLLFGPIPQVCDKQNTPGLLSFLDSSDLIKPDLTALPPAANILMIGAGGANLLKDASRDSKITTVEIDPKMIYFSKKYFLPAANAEQRILEDDARHAIRQFEKNGERFDLIILDAFLYNSPAPALLTAESMASMKNILSSDGVLIINSGVFRSKPEESDVFLASIYKTAGTAFADVSAIWDGDKSRNLIFRLSEDRKASETKSTILRIADKNGILLSDNFNPIEYYGMDRNYEQMLSLKKIFDPSPI